MRMTTRTRGTCLTILIIVISQLLYAQQGSAKRHNLKHGAPLDHRGKGAVTRPPPLPPSRFAMVTRSLLCELCSRVWISYSKRCVDKKIKPLWNCDDVDRVFEEEHAYELGRAGRCLGKLENQFIEDCQKVSDRTFEEPADNLDSQGYNYEEADMAAMSPSGTSDYEESDAPIGWRTIQGEWFQKHRHEISPSEKYSV
ncbi:uncharacterized protein [Dermacentor andersoni]|uniref:uncharacterized protein n=1 Tax=Dermacentor andersoni TaxID=34620 RepID=UPI002417B0A1|nr:uncharacterized protein LOC129387235 [Dermacentor andersoni]